MCSTTNSPRPSTGPGSQNLTEKAAQAPLNDTAERSEEQNDEEDFEEAAILHSIGTEVFEGEKIVIPKSHTIFKVDFGGATFEMSELRAYGKVLRNGCLAYILEKKGSPTEQSPPIRLIFHHYALEKHSVNSNDLTLSLEYNPKKLEVVYPPAANETNFKSFFDDVLSNRQIKLHLKKANGLMISRLDKFLAMFPTKARFSRNEKGLNNPAYHIISKSDYYGLQEDNFLKELTVKCEIAEKAFGGQLEKVSLDPTDDKHVIVHHSDDQISKMKYCRIDDSQRFEVYFPDGTRLEALWAKDILNESDAFSQDDFRLCIPGLDESHRKIILSWEPDGNSWFSLHAIENKSEKARRRKILRSIITELKSPNGAMLASVIFSQFEQRIATEADNGARAVIAESFLDETQKSAAIHALSTPSSLQTKIAAITGPAGTGKTYTLAVCIKAGIHSTEYPKIIVTAKQNNAVERIFESVMGILDKHEKTKVLYLQGSIAAAKTDKETTPLTELIKRYRLQYHMSKLPESEDSHETKRKAVINEVQVIFATLDIIWRDLDHSIFSPDICILDEAGTTSEMDSLIPATKFSKSIKRYILCGDPMQLQPFSPANSPITKRSLLLHLQQSMWGIFRLTDNYRMDPDLSQPLRSIFYNTDSLSKLGMLKKETGCRYLFFDTEHSKTFAGAKETLQCLQNLNTEITSKAPWIKVKGNEMRRGYSFSNSKEILAVIKIIEHLLSFKPLKGISIDAAKIGVLCMYQAQVHDLLDRIRANNPEWLESGLFVSTVDSYQGKEKEIMLISFVRSNDEGAFGFLNDPHRLCCAMSRSRLGQIIIGDFEAIQKATTGEESKSETPSNEVEVTEAEEKSKAAGIKFRGLAQVIARHQWNQCGTLEIPVDHDLPLLDDTTDQQISNKDDPASDTVEAGNTDPAGEDKPWD